MMGQSNLSYIFVSLSLKNLLNYFLYFKVVIITGCDQDIGFSLASHALLIGFTVFGCCEDLGGDGVRRLRKMSHLTSQGAQRLNIIQMNITNDDSMKKAVERIHVLFGERPGLRNWNPHYFNNIYMN